jgi:hypothetical protein
VIIVIVGSTPAAFAPSALSIAKAAANRGMVIISRRVVKGSLISPLLDCLLERVPADGSAKAQDFNGSAFVPGHDAEKRERIGPRLLTTTR